MKRIIIAIASIVFAAGIANAQVVDTTGQYQQNQLQQQELQLQKAEADRVAKEAAKEQERIEKEQARAEKEQAKIEKANEKAIKDQKDAEKKARKEARKQEYGRGLSFDLDINASLLSIPTASGYSNLASLRDCGNVGVGVSFNYPISKRLDFGFGVGYQFSDYAFNNSLTYENGVLDTTSVTHTLYHQCGLLAGRIMVPLRLIRYDKDRGTSYFGLNVGYCIHNMFSVMQASGNDLNFVASWNNTKIVNPWRLEAVIGGTNGKFLFLRPGVQFYYSLLPTFVKIGDGSSKIHELGLRIHL